MPDQQNDMQLAAPPSGGSAHRREGEFINSLKPGDVCQYREDGQGMLCRVIANESDRDAVSIRLEVIATNERNGIYKDAPDGECFTAWGARGYSWAWGWSISPQQGPARPPAGGVQATLLWGETGREQ